MQRLPTIASVAAAKSDTILKLWEGLGYYTRARNLQKAAQVIQERHGGVFPTTFDEVLALPGVGRYTAGAICSIAFGQATPILDGNVMRVLTRLFGIRTDPREKKANARLWEIASELVLKSRDSCSHLNQSLMELGALICTPRNPHCQACPVNTNCLAYRTNQVEVIPNLGNRQKATRRRFASFVVEKQGRYLVRRRPSGVVNAGFWEFPNFELGHEAKLTNSIARKSLGFSTARFTKLLHVNHTITRYRISMEVFKAELNGTEVPATLGRWQTLAQLQRLAFPSAHRKIVDALKRQSGG